MARYKDQREAKKHAAAHSAAMNSFQAARSQYAMALATAAFSDLDAAKTLRVADALAREDFRLRLVETKLLGVMVGDDVVSYELPKEGEAVQAPSAIVSLAKP